MAYVAAGTDGASGAGAQVSDSRACTDDDAGGHVDDAGAAPWVAAYDDNGAVYYFNRVTNESAWYLPEADVAPTSAAAPAYSASSTVPPLAISATVGPRAAGAANPAVAAAAATSVAGAGGARAAAATAAASELADLIKDASAHHAPRESASVLQVRCITICIREYGHMHIRMRPRAWQCTHPYVVLSERTRAQTRLDRANGELVVMRALTAERDELAARVERFDADHAAIQIQVGSHARAERGRHRNAFGLM